MNVYKAFVFKECGFCVVLPRILWGKGQRIQHQAVDAFVGCGEEKGKMTTSYNIHFL